jgi:triosephosphate isomerase
MEWIDAVGSVITGTEDYEVVVCPPFTSLAAVSWKIFEKGYKLSVGAQSVSKFDEGAYTGEINAQMVSEFAKYVLIGHSERRQYFNETNEDISKKVEMSLKSNLTPIVLVRSAEDTLPEGTKYFAWEPVSAIGTGNSIDSEVAAKTVVELKGPNDYMGIYGGSVNKNTIKSYMTNPDIHGVLVGSASFESQSFLELIDAIRSS